jgi:hypothetical protein
LALELLHNFLASAVIRITLRCALFFILAALELRRLPPPFGHHCRNPPGSLPSAASFGRASSAERRSFGGLPKQTIIFSLGLACPSIRKSNEPRAL